MLNEKELIALQCLVHFLNYQDKPTDHDLCFDVSVIDSNGDVLARIERQDVADYQLLFSGSDS